MQWLRVAGEAPLEGRLQLLTRTLLHEVADNLDDDRGGGDISPSTYETAWVAMVRHPRYPNRLAFPESLSWLLKTQQSNGCWDGNFPYAVIPTMAALLALAKAPRQTKQIRMAQARAERYLQQKIPHWDIATYDTPLFEFLTPLLTTELAMYGIQLPVPQLELMAERTAQKLRRLPLDLLYAGKSNIIHGLEALTAVLNYERLRAVQSRDGSYGNSPSATAAVLIHGPTWDEKAARWLRHLSSRAFGGMRGAMPASHPADAFETAWVMHLLLHGGVRFSGKTNATHHLLLHWLQSCLTPSGASYARQIGLPCDVDDTAVIIAVLNHCGMQTPLDALWLFEVDDHFVSYAGERTSSTSANAHALEALLSLRPPVTAPRDVIVRRKRAIAKIIAYLLDQRASAGYWLDKWHISPYYATLSCALALAQVAEPATHQELRTTYTWLLDAQQADGSWGMAEATLEESAYAVLAVRALRLILPFHEAERCRQAITRGQRFLQRLMALRKQGEPLPALWIDKSTYAPQRVVRAATLAALW